MHSKAILFYDERLNILNQILCILNIDDVNNTFFLHKLDNDFDKQNSIYFFIYIFIIDLYK